MLIHPSHQPEARRALAAVGVLLAALVVLAVLPESLKTVRVHDYLALHMALETLSIVVAGLVFGIIWSVRREHLAGNVVLLGCAFFGVALLDFSHMLSAAGMPAYVTASSAGKAIYFWLAACLLGGLALLAAAWRPWKPARAARVIAAWLPAIVVLVVAIHAAYFIAPAWLDAFVDHGETTAALRREAEYVVLAIDLLAALRLLGALHAPRQFNAAGLLATACVMAESSVFFAWFTTAGGLYLVIGHVYKVIGYVFLYRAVFVETVRQPYHLLEASREQLRATLDALPDLLLEMDARGRYLGVHTSFRGQLAAAGGRLVGRTVQEVLSPADARTAMAALDEAGLYGVSRGKVIAVDVAAGGKRWFELSVARKPVPAGADPRYVVVSRDITERRAAEHDLLKFSQAVAQSPVAIVITDLEARIEFVNAAFTRITGFTAGEVAGRNVHLMLHSERTLEATINEMWDTIRRGDTWRGELVNLTKAGREIVESVLIYPLRDADGAVTHYLAHQEDITERKQAAERIRQLSRYDPLTGLPNRTSLYESFEGISAREQTLALLWIDIDHFKNVNDLLGHTRGDRLLQDVARRFRAAAGGGCLLARHSADAFVVVVPGSDEVRAAAQARGLLAAMSRPFGVAGQELSVTASIGIALWTAGAGRLEYLLGKAEAAMYRAKDAGRDQFCFFSPEMQQRTSRVVALASALKQAVARRELQLVYQPQLSLADERIVGAEVLLRWNSPRFGAVEPAEFIPIAEANGLIVSIGEWVLRTALDQWRVWMDRGLTGMTLAVNLSAAQFGLPHLADLVSGQLARSGVPSDCVELELTEAVAMKAPEVAARRMEELHRRRIRLAIDDFGTGYSSLSYLKQFRIDKLKIDQSFVRDIGGDPDDQAITLAVIQLARSLGMRTIAEGVETLEQLEFLRRHGCDEGQGFHFSRPLAPVEFEQFVRAKRGA
ncbi:MAG TPA: EAL domain-containing protein [Rhodanobacteraceae bacterium]|nr:EAL domain-containing protein [Rhodanobacteraceae bacterium]